MLHDTMAQRLILEQVLPLWRLLSPRVYNFGVYMQHMMSKLLCL